MVKSSVSNPHEAIHQESFNDIAMRISNTGTEAYEVLNATDPSAYTEFVEHPELRHPNNQRAKLDRKDIFTKLGEIQKLRQELRNSDYTDRQKCVLESSLSASRLENSFVLANILYNERSTEENVIFHRWANQTLYGKPDRNIFWSLLNEQLEGIEHKDLSPDEQQEFWGLKIILGPVEKVKIARYRPRPGTMERFSGMVEEYFAPFFRHIPEDKEEFSVQEAADIAEGILRDMAPRGSGWHAVVDPNRRAAATSQQDKKIYFPGQRANPIYTRMALQKILVHELGTHAMRSISFERYHAGNLRTGLPGYESFEEGIARVMEQAISHEYKDAGARHYISIGLANFIGKDFRDTYEIQRRLSHLRGEEIKDQTIFNSVQRAFRGTDVLPNNKDLVYYNGNEVAWKFIERNLDDPKLFDKLFLNVKTDITELEHGQGAYEAKIGEY